MQRNNNINSLSQTTQASLFSIKISIYKCISLRLIITRMIERKTSSSIRREEEEEED
jgi:hypothetical protein